MAFLFAVVARSELSRNEEAKEKAMNTLRSAAHLQREIGDDLFAALVISDNIMAVRAFAATLAPDSMTVGGRTYDILSFLKRKEPSVFGSTMVDPRQGAEGPPRGEDDCQHLLKHQDEISAALRGKVAFIFMDWRYPGYPENVACVCWRGGRWVQVWAWLGRGWDGRHLILRHK